MDKAKSAKCPVCRKAAAEKFRPFCSARCADVDLGKWLSESYRVPTEEQPDTSDSENLNSSDAKP